jgi:PAS domain S-box-containing protein
MQDVPDQTEPVNPQRPESAATDAILESISDGVFTVDSHWRIASFNRAAEEITGVAREEALGRICSDVFRSSMCGPDCSLRETLRTGKPVIGRSGFIVDAEGERIPISISTAVWRDRAGNIVGGAETFRDLSEIHSLREELERGDRFGDIYSCSPSMRRVLQQLPAVAESASTVLVLGETGSGKELVARAIHAAGPRAAGPFVAINCGALPDNLLESELFGYKAGAFTGAQRDKPGRFALARGGTLFLDEIGEISPALQVRLLRVLQERRYEPLGSVESEDADVRIVAATHRDLAAEVKSGRFRQDLYYRVNVVRVELPPLRRRKEDIPSLVHRFVAKFNREQSKSVEGVTTEAMSFLVAHDWPGNVRELENAIERAFVGCATGLLGIEHLPEECRGARRVDEPLDGLRGAREQLDAGAIRAALERNGNSRAAAARELGVHKSTFFRMVRRLGLDLPAKD